MWYMYAQVTSFNQSEYSYKFQVVAIVMTLWLKAAYPTQCWYFSQVSVGQPQMWHSERFLFHLHHGLQLGLLKVRTCNNSLSVLAQIPKKIDQAQLLHPICIQNGLHNHRSLSCNLKLVRLVGGITFYLRTIHASSTEADMGHSGILTQFVQFGGNRVGTAMRHEVEH